MIVIERSNRFHESPRLFLKQEEKREIKFLVLHHVQADSADHAIEQFLQHEVSSHFLIDESGKIFELVEENDVAYHAGTSFWAGVDGLNKNSIGIEFINSAPFEKKFSDAQMKSGARLCQYLILKYNIAQKNIVGHCDIAYDKSTNLLDRKQDPSNLFDWEFMAKNAVGIFPKNCKKAAITSIAKTKEMLRDFGYRIINLNNEIDEEMLALAIVFNRRFLNQNSNIWSEESQAILNQLVKN